MNLFRPYSGSRLPLAVGAGLMVASAASAAFYGDWSSPANLETLPGSSGDLNTMAVDGCASLSPDGSQIAFTSNRTGDFDIYIADRLDNGGFGPPVRLPAPVNGSFTDSCPSLLEGKRVIYTSTRDDSAGDLYETRLGPKGWSNPVRFGPNINAPGVQDETADVYEDDQGREVMVFSRRPGANSTGKIWQSIAGAPATLVQGGPHSSAGDNRPSVTKDGKTMYFDSTRTGSLGDTDIYVSHRSSVNQQWGVAEHLTGLSSAAFDARPWISKDGQILIFSSARMGSSSPAPDIWFATRDRTKGYER